ncbi:uncharacterized protein LY89DRAFT_723063 [Mollisia scopiformis]|uniref:Uncharacterized protein n=1 Tax=Mollisia scopiformis TaxID=149040 RepID=A0A194WTD8_MOLSC|nr:uncharacterized protein LY89DRAFT_723063 [Mollisia scopiformis]KUJ11226.1 hypothetical protein LY89DRAFT_723063 [Mollisia scopiformis]
MESRVECGDDERGPGTVAIRRWHSERATGLGEYQARKRQRRSLSRTERGCGAILSLSPIEDMDGDDLLGVAAMQSRAVWSVQSIHPSRGKNQVQRQGQYQWCSAVQVQYKAGGKSGLARPRCTSKKACRMCGKKKWDKDSEGECSASRRERERARRLVAGDGDGDDGQGKDCGKARSRLDRDERTGGLGGEERGAQRWMEIRRQRERESMDYSSMDGWMVRRTQHAEQTEKQQRVLVQYSQSNQVLVLILVLVLVVVLPCPCPVAPPLFHILESISYP